MKQAILTLTAVFCFLAVNAYSAPLNDNTGKIEPVEKTRTEPQQKKTETTTMVKKPVTVKNIWKDMPGYDRFGNLITPKVREIKRNNNDSKHSK
jgi:hypothetical protein